MDNSKPVICVFCGSSHGSDAAHAQAARQFGALLAAHGFDMVFGGGYIGLMGEVAHAAREGGAYITGVMPENLRYLEPPAHEAHRIVFTHDLFDRKKMMMSIADGFAVLPGGVGTLDELFEAVSAVQLGFRQAPIVLLNSGGFWNPLLELLDALVASGFLDGTTRNAVTVADTADDAIGYLIRELKPA